MFSKKSFIMLHLLTFFRIFANAKLYKYNKVWESLV